MDVIHATATSGGVGALLVPSLITAEKVCAAWGYQKIRDEFHGAERTIIIEKRLRISPSHLPSYAAAIQ